MEMLQRPLARKQQVHRWALPPTDDEAQVTVAPGRGALGLLWDEAAGLGQAVLTAPGERLGMDQDGQNLVGNREPPVWAQSSIIVLDSGRPPGSADTLLGWLAVTGRKLEREAVMPRLRSRQWRKGASRHSRAHITHRVRDQPTVCHTRAQEMPRLSG